MVTMPRYRAVTDHASPSGLFRVKGDVFDMKVWPTTGDAEPLNDAARRIVAYWQIHRYSLGRPNMPWSSAYERFILPAMFSDYRSTSYPPPPQQRPGMPIYQTGNAIPLNGGRIIAEGVETVWLGWPLGRFRPMNEDAERVARYFAEHGEDRNLLPAPWCLFDDALFLPEKLRDDPDWWNRQTVGDYATVPKGNPRLSELRR